MKFVHLAPRSAIGLIKKHGLRLGNGRWGRGLYAMPLIRLPRGDLDQGFEGESPIVCSEPISSARFWRPHLFGRRVWFPSGPQAAAIVFTLPPWAWPVQFHILTYSSVRIRFVEEVKRSGNSDLMSPEEFRDASQGGWAWLHLKVNSAAQLGTAIHAFVAAGGMCFDGDEMELLIESPIPPSCIERIVPYYRSNAELRSARGRARHYRNGEHG